MIGVIIWIFFNKNLIVANYRYHKQRYRIRIVKVPTLIEEDNLQGSVTNRQVPNMHIPKDGIPLHKIGKSKTDTYAQIYYVR